MNTDASTDTAEGLDTSVEPSEVAPLVARGLRPRDAAKYIGHSEAYLKKARAGKKTDPPGPEFKRNGRRITYLRENLDEWLDRLQPGKAA